ncbi:MAG: RNA polymerase sigma factor [Muribaculaceae bacterium]|nr:RNA polymerase sigma factor [Muribaculaceae bacterium]
MLSRFDELKLIARCVATDDRNAFGRLVEEYQHGLRRFLLNLTLGNSDLADDLAQETFIKAYLSIRSFKGLSKFKTWLYRIAYNEFYTHMRQCREEAEESIIASHQISTAQIEATDARIDIEQCLTALNESERTVVLLFYIEDLPIAKIAQITSLPQGTIKSLLSRARIKMAKLFDN